MLRPAQELLDCRLRTADGKLVKILDLLFDDESWELRHVVVRTPGWIRGRRVLLPIDQVGQPSSTSEGVLPASASLEQLESQPPLDENPPVHRQQELIWSGVSERHFWGGPRPTESNDVHLRSVREVIGYEVVAPDGRAGTLSGLLVDDADFRLRFLVVAPRQPSPAEPKSVIPTHWVKGFDWARRSAKIGVSRSALGRDRSASGRDPSDSGEAAPRSGSHAF